MVNDTQRAEEITLEDIADLRPPAYMNKMADLQTFRCTKGRVGIIPHDPDYTSQSVYNLWNQAAEHGTVSRGETTTVITESQLTTEAAPLAHSRTPLLPLPPPRDMTRNKVTLTPKGPHGHSVSILTPPSGSPSRKKNPGGIQLSQSTNQRRTSRTSRSHPECIARILHTRDG